MSAPPPLPQHRIPPPDGPPAGRPARGRPGSRPAHPQPGPPRGAKHSGSVSHVVYSADGAWRRGMPSMKRPATRVADLLNPAAVLLPAANVIMQLSLPGVGYGVLESPVDSGNVYKHPFKRARTTGTYLAVATIGTDVRPRADPRSRRHRAPSGAIDVVESGVLQRVRSGAAAVGGRLPVPLLRRPARVPVRPARRGESPTRSTRTPGELGTTLQVREAMWPPDRVAFDDYWKRSLEDLRIDPCGPRTSARGGGDGVPALAAARAGRTVQSVRDDGISAPGVPQL